MEKVWALTPAAEILCVLFADFQSRHSRFSLEQAIVIFILPIAGILFVAFLWTVPSYLCTGSPATVLIGSAIQPTATAGVAVLVVFVFAMFNPNIPNVNLQAQARQLLVLFGFPAVFISTPLAFLCAVGALVRSHEDQSNELSNQDTPKSTSFETLAARVSLSVVGCGLGLGVLLIALSLVK